MDGWLVSAATKGRIGAYKQFFVVAVLDPDAAIIAVRDHLGSPAVPLELVAPAGEAHLVARRMQQGDVVPLGVRASRAKWHARGYRHCASD
jgi:hypothetical protein